MSTDIAIGNEYASTWGLVVTIINIRNTAALVYAKAGN